jgi:hypothetical protein
MMRREAAWLGSELQAIEVDDLGSVLSVGSGNRDFRRRFQPWIDERVFEPLERRGVRVLHHELEPSDGVDVWGDLRDPQVRQRLAGYGVRTVLCLNVLEHVPQPAEVAAAVEAAIPVGGRAIVTVPRRFPYHADPIDTMFRPEPEELARLFSAKVAVRADSLPCESLLAHWIAKPGKLGALVKVFNRPQIEDQSGSPSRPAIRSLARMIFVSTELTYAVVRRTPVEI